MNVLIVYYSQTGNTAQIAQAIHEAVSDQGHQADLKEMAEVTAESLNSYNLVFLGTTCHDSDLAKPAKRLLENVEGSPPFKLAGFVTHATQMPGGNERAAELHERWAGNCVRTFQQVCEEKQISFLGYFHCQGAPSPPIAAFIHNTVISDEEEWQSYIAQVEQHPDETDLQNARVFAGQILEAC